MRRLHESFLVSLGVMLVYLWVAGLAVAYEASVGRFIAALAFPPFAVLEGVLYWITR